MGRVIRFLLLVAIFGLCPPGGADAVDLAGVTQVTFGWAPASGPVVGYVVFVSRDGEVREPEQTVTSTQALVSGSVDETITVTVRAFDTAGTVGPFSEDSEPVTFRALPPPPEPEEPPLDPPADDPTGGPPVADDPPVTEDPAPTGVLFADDFESYADREDPVGWRDSGAGNALSEDPSLFEVFALTDGTSAFGTISTETNIHSHVTVGGSASWHAYETSGRMSITHPEGGVGVTLLSDYPRSDAYYRLRRYGGYPFLLANHGGRDCVGSTLTDVVPRPGVWYRYRITAQPEGPDVRIRARVWAEGSAEPATWPIDCLGPGGADFSGSVGVWSMGPGLKLWDDVLVTSLDAAPSPAPEAPADPTEDPPAVPTDPPSGNDLLAAETFESYAEGDDPLGWLDTRERNSMQATDLFEVFRLDDGTAAFGTESLQTNVHSHWLSLPSSLSSYELRGQMWMEAAGSGIGVTLYSDYPHSDSYYRLRRYSYAPSFRFSPHPASTCEGQVDTGVVPQPGTWYNFRVQALPETSGGTRLRAKVWADGTSEPGWQADCIDRSGLRHEGVPGVWSMGDGLKLWDELEVIAIDP